MLPDMMQAILTAENEAHQIKLLVLQKSQEALEAAEKAGEESLSATLARAASEITHLTRVTDKKAMDAAAELASSTANRTAALRARAEKRLDAVARHIVERIVNV